MSRKTVVTEAACLSLLLISSYFAYSLAIWSFVEPSYLFCLVLGVIVGCISLFLHLTTRNNSSGESSV